MGPPRFRCATPKLDGTAIYAKPAVSAAYFCDLTGTCILLVKLHAEIVSIATSMQAVCQLTQANSQAKDTA